MDLYRDNILDHYHNPRNHKTLDAPTHHCCTVNPTCGDTMCIAVRVSDAGVIEDIAFNGSGCAISQAAASMLTEHVRGATITDVQNMTRNEMLDLIGVPIGIGRMRCALLGWETLRKALHSSNATDCV